MPPLSPRWRSLAPLLVGVACLGGCADGPDALAPPLSDPAAAALLGDPLVAGLLDGLSDPGLTRTLRGSENIRVLRIRVSAIDRSILPFEDWLALDAIALAAHASPPSVRPSEASK